MAQRSFSRIAGAAIIAAALLPPAAAAQTAAAPTPAQVLTEVLDANVIVTEQGAHYSGYGVLSGAGDALLTLIKQQTATQPLGTSSGSFTWEFDRSLGIVVRKSQSFGPIFADRAMTTGRHKLSVGVTSQHTAWRSLAGHSLPGGDVFTRQDFGDDSSWTFRSTLDLQTDRTVVNATFGLTDRVDLNLVVPFGRTSMAGAIDFSETSNGVEIDKSHQALSAAGEGFGDVTARAKVAVVARPAFAMAVAGDIRFPTGSTDKMLGAGAVQERISAIVSGAVGRYGPHGEIGFLRAGKGLRLDSFGTVLSAEPSNEIVPSVGLDVAVNRQVTFAVDVLSRMLRHSAKVTRVTLSDPGLDQILFQTRPADVSIVMGTVGAKVAIGSVWLLSGSVLFPLNDPSLKPGVTPVIGFERSF